MNNFLIKIFRPLDRSLQLKKSSAILDDLWHEQKIPRFWFFRNPEVPKNGTMIIIKNIVACLQSKAFMCYLQ